MRRETESSRPSKAGRPSKGGQALLGTQLAIDAVDDGVEPQLFI
jgi:hypothetical protein